MAEDFKRVSETVYYFRFILNSIANSIKWNFK